ncbi:hypothetical protein T4A_6217 [Trichinella pseudospiralis]|uniref:Uncharacterized protein n=1 Tax=Trichinella pseudospiralis TaxID=6337 RepID=A0A0V1EA21_TRIPS|nr:hypothetical protein T4A_6217 [Trichinella pseudospiralis]
MPLFQCYQLQLNFLFLLDLIKVYASLQQQRANVTTMRPCSRAFLFEICHTKGCLSTLQHYCPLWQDVTQPKCKYQFTCVCNENKHKSSSNEIMMNGDNEQLRKAPLSAKAHLNHYQ